MGQEIHTALWRRLDLPGHEACRVASHPMGWRIAGAAVFVDGQQACRLDYVIRCDSSWRTVSTVVEGWIGDREIDIEIFREPSGVWQLNGQDCPQVAGCIDIDLNFSPSTNLLPIRRLAPEVGQAVEVRAAWLRFPSFELEPLDQVYTRLEPNLYRYDSAGGRFVAPVTVDDAGLVMRYGDLWTRDQEG
jgi:uncharacterized protein